ncbi:MAG: TlpA family protein disulfide reductase [Phocaeicola sp.]
MRIYLILLCLISNLVPSLAQEGSKYILVEGSYFAGRPPGVHSYSGMALHKDTLRNQVLELFLPEGQSLSDEAKRYSTPVENVPNGEGLLKIAKSGLTKKVMMSSTSTLILPNLVGKPFPSFQVEDMEGKKWNEKMLVGKPALFNFWYTGCRSCIKEMPELNRWKELYPDVNYFAITFDEMDKIAPIIEQKKFAFTHFAAAKFFFERFKVTGMPVTILVDKKGVIRYWEEGSGTAKLAYLFDKLKLLVEE